MQNKKIFILLIIPLVIGGGLYVLGRILGPPLYELEEKFREVKVWIYIILFPTVIPLCGLFLFFVTVPALFRNSLINWKNNTSWKWQLTMVLPLLLIATWMQFHGAFPLAIPIGLIVSEITLVNLIRSAKVDSKSTFFHILLGLAVVIGGITFLVLYLFLIWGMFLPSIIYQMFQSILFPIVSLFLIIRQIF
ncbi:MAG: hypothetical protein AB1397_03485 [bacterium]